MVVAAIDQPSYSILGSKLQLCPGALQVAFAGFPALPRPKVAFSRAYVRVEERHHVDLAAQLTKLVGNLNHNQAGGGMARQLVGTAGHKSADMLHIFGRQS